MSVEFYLSKSAIVGMEAWEKLISDWLESASDHIYGIPNVDEDTIFLSIVGGTRGFYSPFQQIQRSLLNAA